jgi:hypothetical protein
MEVVRTLSRHLPRYENSVLCANSVADCEVAIVPSLSSSFNNIGSPGESDVGRLSDGVGSQEAGKVEASLVELFKNFDIGVKKITAMKFESEKVRGPSTVHIFPPFST